MKGLTYLPQQKKRRHFHAQVGKVQIGRVNFSNIGIRGLNFRGTGIREKRLEFQIYHVWHLRTYSTFMPLFFFI
jgi:hypothetical protein